MAKDFYIKESQLDEYQMRLLMSTLDRSMVVSGCAGSGKSVIALHKAKRIQNEKGNGYQIIVFTKALAKYMNDGRSQLELTKSFTYHWDWVNRMGCPSSDYIIVDEVQDFTRDEIDTLKKAARKCFFFFGDTAQSIYEGLKDTQDIRDIAYEARVSEFPLYFNYRLPISIARITEGYIGRDTQFSEGTYKNTSTKKPRIIRYASIDDQIAAIKRIIDRGSLKDVGILLPHNEDVKMMYNKLTSMGINCECQYHVGSYGSNDFERKESLNFDSDNPKIMTYHSAKGLQFETVFLPMCTASEEKERKPLYVAMTRSYQNLYVMHSGNLSPFFRNVPVTLYETTEADQVDDI